jgi:hypothetical protein
MGNLCRARGRAHIVADETEKKKELQQIFDFDWNQGNKNYLTVEETIMRHITNDIGEFLTPQTTQVLFAEFKKFMFLNKAYLEQLKREEIVEDAKRQIKDYKTCYTGLVAPPLIDSVWILLMSLKTSGGKLTILV